MNFNNESLTYEFDIEADDDSFIKDVKPYLKENNGTIVQVEEGKYKAIFITKFPEDIAFLVSDIRKTFKNISHQCNQQNETH